MKKAIYTVAGNEKTYEEIRESIKELFNMKDETLIEEELERTVRAYIYLTDNRIPVSAAVVRKRSK